MTNLFPIIIIILMLCASVVCLINRDAGHALYWFAGAVINISATFLMK